MVAPNDFEISDLNVEQGGQAVSTASLGKPLTAVLKSQFGASYPPVTMTVRIAVSDVFVGGPNFVTTVTFPAEAGETIVTTIPIDLPNGAAVGDLCFAYASLTCAASKNVSPDTDNSQVKFNLTA
jgi:hypothetical protein